MENNYVNGNKIIKEPRLSFIYKLLKNINGEQNSYLMYISIKEGVGFCYNHQVLNYLCEKKLVWKEKDKKNKRRNRLHLTDKGKKFLNGLHVFYEDEMSNKQEEEFGIN